MKLLIAVPHAHVLSVEFNKAIDRLSYDILWVNGYNEKDAYAQIKRTFLDMPAYTHLAILPDDLEVNYTGVEDLVFDSMSTELPIMCGVCNVDMKENLYNYNIAPLPKTEKDSYRWTTIEELESLPRHVQVEYNGFSFMIMKREVVETASFTQNYKNVATDYIFCKEMYEKNVPIWCNTKARFKHYRYQGLPLPVTIPYCNIEIRETEQMEKEIA